MLYCSSGFVLASDIGTVVSTPQFSGGITNHHCKSIAIKLNLYTEVGNSEKYKIHIDDYYKSISRCT